MRMRHRFPMFMFGTLIALAGCDVESDQSDERNLTVNATGAPDPQAVKIEKLVFKSKAKLTTVKVSVTDENGKTTKTKDLAPGKEVEFDIAPSKKINLNIEVPKGAKEKLTESDSQSGSTVTVIIAPQGK
jgi:hypothetical protein